MSDRTASISLARARLKQAEKLHDVLSFLKSSLEKRISSFRERMPKWCISDLPNELLLLIFDYSEPDLLCLRQFLQVSKRFSQLVLSSPRLWAQQTLTLHSPSYIIDAVAKRSGMLGFRARFNIGDLRGIFDPEHTIVQLCAKWSSLTLFNISQSELQGFISSVPSINLVSLKEMIIDCDRWRMGGWRFNSSWSLPHLISLKCINCVPQSLCATTLSECTFTFSASLPINGVTAFLSSAPCIEKLSITLQSMSTRAIRDLEGSISTTLPNLKHLVVQLAEVHRSLIENLFQAILSPNITSFLAIVGLKSKKGWPDASKSLRLLTRRLKVRYPMLKRVGLGAINGEFCAEEICYDQHDVNAILEELPRGVEELVLLIHNHDFVVSIPSGAVRTLEGLRSLGFVHCNHLFEDFFDMLAILLRRYAVTLANIYIDSCKIYSGSDRDVGLQDFMRDNDVERCLIREGVAKSVSVGLRSVLMMDMLALLQDFLKLVP